MNIAKARGVRSMEELEKNRKKVVAFISIVLSIVFTLIMLEIFLRVVPLTRDSYCVRFRSDPDYKYHYMPNQSLKTLFGQRITFNKFGFRKTMEYEKKKGSSTYRILILGDSVGAGLNVDDSDIYTTGLAEQISKKIGKRIELINGSCEGYNTFNELAWYEKVGSKFNPDEVWLLYVSNDAGMGPYAFYVSKEGYSTTNPDSIIPLSIRFKLRKSALFIFIYEKIRLLFEQKKPSVDFERLRSPSLQAFRQLVDAITRTARLKVFFLPRRPAVEKNILSPTFSWISSECKKRNIPFFDVTPALKNIYDKGKDPYLPYDPVHLSVYGHKKLSYIIVSTMK